MLSVAPAPEPAWEEGDERVQLSLHSTLVEREAERTYNASSDGSYERLYRRFWNMVRRSLQDGESSSKFVVARQEHPLRIAAYNSPAGCDDEPVEDMGEPRASADGGRDPGS
jgi:hypothetical protein